MNKLKYGLMVLVLCKSVNVLADDSFTWNGYIKNGAGYSSNGQGLKHDGDLVNNLGRLGTDFATNIASRWTKKWDNGKGQWAKYTLQLDMYGNDFNDQSKTFKSHRNYVSIGGLDFLPEDGQLWMGVRKINYGAVNVIDIKWLDIRGTGFGYKGSNFNLSFLATDSNQDTDTNGNDIEQAALALKYNFGSLETRALFVVPTEYDDYTYDEGLAKNALHLTGAYSIDSYYGLSSGKSKVILQVGSGVEADELGRSRPGAIGLSESSKDLSYRMILDGTAKLSDTFSLNPLFMYSATQYDNSDTNDTTTINLGGKLSQKLSHTTGLVYEAFIANYENKDGVASADGSQYKFAFGPSVKLDFSGKIKPEMAMTVAYIAGDDEVIDLGDDGSKESELRFSYSIETTF